MSNMKPKFGTSGLRGLVTELTSGLIHDYVRSFAATCPMGSGLFVAHDLRDSSVDIAKAVILAGRASGLSVTQCGAAPTPALALSAMQAGAASIMVTGSHIPADRNGLKFYTPDGEINKSHEAAILGAVGRSWQHNISPSLLRFDTLTGYLRRYEDSFADALIGMDIGIFGHSAVGRDFLMTLVERLGGKAHRLGWSDVFIPLDTEAVPSKTRQQLLDWAMTKRFDAIISTDGDGDRPLITNQHGQIVAGDVLGQIAAGFLNARRVVTPVSSNTGLEKSGNFGAIDRCKIGSPYVIAAMQKAEDDVVGYEANGGFLLGYAASGPSGELPALMTRDAVLPMLALLTASRTVENGIKGLIDAQPARFTATDRLENVPTVISHAFVERLRSENRIRSDFLAQLGLQESMLDLTDGLRIVCSDDRIIHLRPSGNAPELRLYVEATDPRVAQATLKRGLILTHAMINLNSPPFRE